MTMNKPKKNILMFLISNFLWKDVHCVSNVNGDKDLSFIFENGKDDVNIFCSFSMFRK
jgi:hypothetical protein